MSLRPHEILENGLDVSKWNIERLCGIHITRYQDRVRAGMLNPDAPVNVAECLMYLDIWRSIRKKGFEWGALNEDECREVRDAIESGE